MDRERFGRALGKGARIAARTALEAVDAAAAPSPPPRPAQPVNAAAGAVEPPSRTTPLERAATVRQNLRSATRGARAGAFTPLRHASRALWHELTGSFFALFALSFALGVWHTRGSAYSALRTDRIRFDIFCILAALFTWFSVSSFMRARRRP